MNIFCLFIGGLLLITGLYGLYMAGAPLILVLAVMAGTIIICLGTAIEEIE